MCSLDEGDFPRIRSDHLQVLRERRGLFSDGESPHHGRLGTISRIALVGAVYGDYGFSKRDPEWVAAGCSLLKRHGFALSDELKYFVYDLKRGHDFLNPRAALLVDAVIVCCVPYGHNWFDRLFFRVGGDDELRLSPSHYLPGAWTEALERTNALAAVTFSAGGEVDASVLQGRKYVALPDKTGDFSRLDGRGKQSMTIGSVLRADIAG